MMPPKACYTLLYIPRLSHASLSSEKEEMSAETVLQILLMLHGIFQMVPNYGTCQNKVTVLRPCDGYGYGRSTGTGTGVAQGRARASHGYNYDRTTCKVYP